MSPFSPVGSDYVNTLPEAFAVYVSMFGQLWWRPLAIAMGGATMRLAKMNCSRFLEAQNSLLAHACRLADTGLYSDWHAIEPYLHPEHGVIHTYLLFVDRRVRADIDLRCTIGRMMMKHPKYTAGNRRCHSPDSR
jgi:hypothetical protein